MAQFGKHVCCLQITTQNGFALFHDAVCISVYDRQPTLDCVNCRRPCTDSVAGQPHVSSDFSSSARVIIQQQTCSVQPKFCVHNSKVKHFSAGCCITQRDLLLASSHSRLTSNQPSVLASVKLQHRGNPALCSSVLAVNTLTDGAVWQASPLLANDNSEWFAM